MSENDIKKIVLAYSGGLDTSVIVPWLKENYPGAEVVCFAADVGQGEELSGLNAKAVASGALKCVVHDLREEFAIGGGSGNHSFQARSRWKRNPLPPPLQLPAFGERSFLPGRSRWSASCRRQAQRLYRGRYAHYQRRL